jgi:hypothetical protein
MPDTIETITHLANEPKHHLMGLASVLRHEGLEEKAKALDVIIGQLEAWQNTP